MVMPRSIGDLPVVGRLLAHDHAEDRRLAGAVRPDQADLLAAEDRGGRVDEQDLRAVLLADLIEPDHRPRSLLDDGGMGWLVVRRGLLRLRCGRCCWLCCLASMPVGGSVASEMGAIEQGMKATKYEHRLRVDPRKGVYSWDCSIMAAWVLERSAPAAHGTLGAKPLARDFYRVIEQAPADKPRRGWQRSDRRRGVAPGDVFAWLKPRDVQAAGEHGARRVRRRQAVAPSAPRRRLAAAHRRRHAASCTATTRARWAARAASAPPRSPSWSTPAARPVAYGWYGELQDPATYVPTQIAFGRVFR